ncbi:MAG: XkdQ/YqbQ family protein, partial [Cetobacterium sp.]
MLKITLNGKSYINCFLNVTWSGSIKNSARKLDVTFLKGSVEIELGDKVDFFVNDDLIFKGMVYRYDTSTSKTEESFVAFDEGFRLTANTFVENFYQQSPSEITKNILSKLNLESGVFPKDSVKCDFPAWQKTAYEIILTAYKIQHEKDKKIYSIVDNLGKIEVVEQGTIIKNSRLSTGENILQATYSQSIEEMINKIVIYENKEDKPQILGTKENSEDLKKYGVFQSVQEVDKKNIDYSKIQNSLKSVKELASITCLGDVEFESGYSVPVKISNISKLNGIFLIETDSHN